MKLDQPAPTTQAPAAAPGGERAFIGPQGLSPESHTLSQKSEYCAAKTSNWYLRCGGAFVVLLHNPASPGKKTPPLSLDRSLVEGFTWLETSTLCFVRRLFSITYKVQRIRTRLNFTMSCSLWKIRSASFQWRKMRHGSYGGDAKAMAARDESNEEAVCVDGF